MQATRRLADAALSLFPAALVVWLSFSGGGFFPSATGVAAVAVAVVLVLRLTLAERPLDGLGRLGLAAIAALGLYTLWTLASTFWSDAPARAMIEYDRALLYLLLLTLFASVPRTNARVGRLVRSVAAAIAVVAVSALVTRILPEVWHTEPNIVNNRLSFPLTYWNGLGLLAALGVILGVHLASSVREPRPVRVLAAGLVPAVACTVFFTFSRGAIVAGAAGLIAYAVLARPRALVSGLLATVPASAIALKTAYDADLLATKTPATSGAVEQGEHVALVVGAMMLLAAGMRALLLLLDARTAGLRVPRRARIPAAVAGVIAAALAITVVATAFDGAGYVERQYDRFVHGKQVKVRSDLRDRLLDPGNNGRLDHWRVALKGTDESVLRGSGAGTYANLWTRHRRDEYTVSDAHSLYLEVIGELGAVGIALLAAALAAIGAAHTRSLRGTHGASYGAMLAATLAWALHAGVDWDWELPAVTLFAFVLGGAATARKLGETPLVPRLGQSGRAIAALGVAVLAITPWVVASSEAHLRESVAAFKANDCPRAIDEALAANSAVGVRPEPFAILGFCDVRGGVPRLGARMLQNAVSKDPGNWEWHYGLALTRGAAGLDPRPAIRAARRLNPLSGLLIRTENAFAGKDPRKWRRRALAARLPIR